MKVCRHCGKRVEGCPDPECEYHHWRYYIEDISPDCPKGFDLTKDDCVDSMEQGDRDEGQP